MPKILNSKARWLHGVVLAMGLAVLTSCGGGGSDTSTKSGLTVTTEFAPAVKQIDDPTNTVITYPDEQTASIATTQPFLAGDVIVHNGRGIKLGDQLTVDAATGRRLHVLETPRLNELYSKLEVDGTLTELSATTASQQRARPLAWKLDEFKCPLSNTIAGDYFGVKCEFAFKDSTPGTKNELAKVKGSIEAGSKFTAKKFDFIKNTGSAQYDYVISGKLALELSAGLGTGTLDDKAKDEVCSSSLALKGGYSNGRVLLAAPSIVLATGVELIFPVCIAAGTRVNVSGEIMGISSDVKFSVAIGDGKPPRLGQTPTTGLLYGGDSAAVWSVDPGGSGVITLKVSGGGELAVEASLEVSAVRLLYQGFAARLVGKANMEGRFAPAMVGGSTTLGFIRATPLACVTLGLSGNFQVDYYASVFGFSAVGIGGAAKVALADIEIKKFEEKFGICGKSSAQVVVTSTANPTAKDQVLRLDASVSGAPTRDEIAYDESPSGEVVFTNLSTGVTLCRTSISASGIASCGMTFAAEGNYPIEAKYKGDSKYKETTPAPLIQVINQIVDLNDFRFEIKDSSADGPSVCTSYIQTHGWLSPNVVGDFERCSRSVTPLVRCVGQGCVPNRFFITGESISTQSTRIVVWSDGQDSCPSLSDTYYGTELSYGSSRVYPAVNWGPIGTSFGIINPYALTVFSAYPSVGPLTYDRHIGNVKFIPSISPNNVACATIGHDVDITARIYDYLRGAYFAISLTSSIK